MQQYQIGMMARLLQTELLISLMRCDRSSPKAHPYTIRDTFPFKKFMHCNNEFIYIKIEIMYTFFKLQKLSFKTL